MEERIAYMDECSRLKRVCCFCFMGICIVGDRSMDAKAHSPVKL